MITEQDLKDYLGREGSNKFIALMVDAVSALERLKNKSNVITAYSRHGQIVATEDITLLYVAQCLAELSITSIKEQITKSQENVTKEKASKGKGV